MKIKVLILILFVGGVFLHACQKDIDIFVPDPGQLNGPDTSWQNSVTSIMPVWALRNNLLQTPYEDTITVDANTDTITTPFGLQVIFPPHCCTNAAGQAITGKVLVEIMAIKKKGDMIRQNKPSAYNDSMLAVAGQIFVQLKKEGQLLQLAPNISINIRYADSPINPQMKFYLGDETNAQHFNWLPTPTPSADTITMAQQHYEIRTMRQRWISVATLYDVNPTAPKVQLSADIASYFTNANTIVFTVFKDVQSVVAMQADINSRQFITGKLPVGKEVTVVVISKQGNDYYLGYQPAVTQITVANPLIQLVHVEPVKKSLPQILAFLSTL